MAETNIRNLCEWFPLSDVFQKIPLKIQKGIFFSDLNVTCVDAVDEFIALGSDAGIVFWYNRRINQVQKLRTEFSTTLTCIKVVSSVEHLIAVGNQNGEVTVFQIPKELPNDLKESKAIASMIKTQPLERYTIHSENRVAITCVAWSKNGMKLFSGDASGVIILTEFDYMENICRSTNIVNEAYGIVQMSFKNPWLLVSTVYRAIVCTKEVTTPTEKWKLLQIGKTDRKFINNFGAVFVKDESNNQTPSIICSRPGFRFWLSDVGGNVSKTFLLKESVLETPIAFEVPLLNHRYFKPVDLQRTHFGPCYTYCDSYIVTYCDSIVYIINLEKLKVEATIRRLRKIQYLAINGSEIYILEGGRNLIRLALSPDFESNGLLPVIHQASEDTVVDADECIELPPIEKITLDTPLECVFKEHNLLREDKLLLEHSRKLEVFEKISRQDYDDSILYGKGTKRKKRVKKMSNENGIVEIARQADTIDDESNNKIELKNSKTIDILPNSSTHLLSPNSEFKSDLLQARFCESISAPPHQIQFIQENEILSNDEIGTNLRNDSASIPNVIKCPTETPIPYPLEYITSHSEQQFEWNEAPTSSTSTFTSSKTSESSKSDDESEANTQILKDILKSKENITSEIKEVKLEQSKSKKLPKNMRMPNLWNIKIEKYDNNQSSDEDKGSSEIEDSEWEFL